MSLSGEMEGCNLRPVAKQQLLLHRDQNVIPHSKDTKLAGAEEDEISEYRPEDWLVESPRLKGTVHHTHKKKSFLLEFWSLKPLQ